MPCFFVQRTMRENGYTMRLARTKNAENCYLQGFSNPNAESVRLTGADSCAVP